LARWTRSHQGLGVVISALLAILLWPLILLGTKITINI
jgi:hypothetical protein